MQPAASAITGPRRITTAEHSTSGFCSRSLVYIKSSLTGDENDYVFHYKRRYSAFPHETTVDQMFSGEQFEAYRALGYHTTFGLFDRRDDFAKRDPAEFPDARNQTGAARPSVSAQDDGRRAEPATALRRIVTRVGAGARPNPSST
jgi:hypothetical protein